MTITRRQPRSDNGHGHTNGQAAALGATGALSSVLPSLPPLSQLETLSTARLQALTTILDRFHFASQHGFSFLNTDGSYKRDLYGALGYARQLRFRDYRERYNRGGIAARIVEAYPLATWSSDARLTEDANANTNTAFEDAAGELFDRLNVWSRLTRADILANIGRYSVVLIGAAGKLDSPLPKRLKSILYLLPLGEDNATIQKWDTDPASPRFGMPATYQVNLGADPHDVIMGSTAPAAKQVIVHQSRILHVADGMLEDDVYGRPRLRAVWNYLDDLDKVVGGGAEAAWKRMDPGMQMDVDAEMPISQTDIDAMEDQAEEYLHGLRRILQTRGTKVNLLSTTVAGFGPNAASIVELICATTGTPQRILMGSERGQLASEQDRDNWGDRITERRRQFAVPLVRQFVDRLIDGGALPTPKGSKQDDIVPFGKYKYVVTWPRVNSLDSETTAEVLSKLAGANQANSQAGGGLLFTADEIRHKAVGLGPRPKEAEVPYGKPTDPAAAVPGANKPTAKKAKTAKPAKPARVTP